MTASPAIDPEVREALIDAVRRFVAREVVPVASDLEHADEYPETIVEQMKAMGLFGVTIPEEYGGLGLDLLTYIGVVEELSYGWMSLSGVVNTHTIAATILLHHGTEAQRRRWLPDLASGERRGALVALRARRRQRHPQHLVPRDARRRGVRHPGHQDVGHQRDARRPRRGSRPAPTRASRASWSRRSRGRRSAASR